MYLKQIKTKGFKSFAEKITIDLNNKITGIVGPNGSGKSNVVDAVRWVLGEQSVKSLRGDGNMTDVIFQGSKSRNKANLASVTLTFDNTDNYLPLNYTEIEIKRTVYNDGSNEYFINNEKCRLKDISDLLLDSGASKESFNIISQGKIDEILLSKPLDRRIIFEEAAGVLKYKKRKIDALKKLEKAHTNMDRVEDIIKELNDRLIPLKKQKDKAYLYEQKYENLKETDIALTTYNITNLTTKYKQNKEKINKLNEEILLLNTTNNNKEVKLTSYKNDIENLDIKINSKREELLKITKKLEQINSEKNILLERKKYEVDNIKLHTALINLKEEKLTVENQIEKTLLEINSLNKNKDIKNLEIKKINNEIKDIKLNKNNINTKITNKIKEKELIKHKIEILKNDIENSSNIPYQVKKILKNIKLVGIHNILGNILEIEEKYSTSISVTLGSIISNVIVDNEINAKEAINYLKKENLGRVTFMPLNIIKPKYIKEDILSKIKNENGFIGIASDLVKYDKKYENIILNILGTTIVMSDIDSANNISKKINNFYKVVTLSGEVINVSGSITGGKLKVKNIINDKFELENLLSKKTTITNEISIYENDINEIDNLLKSSEDKLYIINKDFINLNEQINSKDISKVLLEERLNSIINDLKGTDNIINNNLSKQEDELINLYYDKEKEKNEIEYSIKNLTNEKDYLVLEKDKYEHSLKLENNIFKEKSKEVYNLEIENNRFDVKIDTLLNYLSEEYSITYENAVLNYKLNIDKNEAKNLIINLKKEIKDLGPINTDSKEEFEEVNTRYEFLLSQKNDLIEAENTLLDIINQMDTVMKKEFINSFNIISKHFEDTFKELFKGGTAKLSLTDKDDVLSSGIEIYACPPGKNLTTINLLSGGEKTFTAISLLFAILKSREVPFCILDEVEAALDDANVESFGNYLQKLKEKTQFILITHKKKTMEFVDTLYGITMQESGVSKLVSVRLEEIK